MYPKVVFVGEPCVDQGGPLREFFTLTMREMVTKSGLFEGAPENAHDALALQRNNYEIAGSNVDMPWWTSAALLLTGVG